MSFNQQRNVVLTPHQGTFSFQQMDTITGKKTPYQNAELWNLIPADISLTQFLLLRLKAITQSGTERL